MIKRTMLAACLAALAFAALPAIAAAEETHNPGDPVLTGLPENTAFTVTGIGNSVLRGPANVTCKKSSGSGVFADGETGTLSLKFEECTGPLGVACTTEGQAKGVIVPTANLTFHLKTVVHEGVHKPGILITPNSVVVDEEEIEKVKVKGTHFATFKCSLLKVVVGGPTTAEKEGKKTKGGIIGTITSPEENHKSNTAKISFKPALNGSGEPTTDQTHQTVTNDEHDYNLWSSTSGGATSTASEEAEGEIKFPAGVEPELSTTPTE